MTYPSGPYGYGYAPPPPPPRPGVIPLAPLSFSEILTGAFTTYGRYWKPLIGVAVAAYTAVAVLAGAALLVAWAAVGEDIRRLADLPSGQDPEFADIQPLIVAFASVWLLVMAAYVVCGGLVSAAVPAVVQEAVLGRPLTFGAAWRRAWSRLGAVIGSVFLTMAATVVPMLLFLVGFALLMAGVITGIAASDGGSADEGPGLAVVGLIFFLGALALLPLALWIVVRFSLAPTVAVIEGQGPVTSLRRSAALVKGSWWRVFGCTIGAGLMVGTVSGVLQQVLAQLGSFPLSTVNFGENPTPSEIVAAFGGVFFVLTIAQLLVQAVAAPFVPLVSGLLYVDQRIRKENLAPVLAETAAAAGPPFSR
ncbi:oxidoreductase [Streptomyces sp. NPDC051921]|uniref:oxidoreductase n=1 Tax=Streptomyces sp. NPDC051921 TaxID=3155806 RepID=UPI0034409E97